MTTYEKLAEIDKKIETIINILKRNDESQCEYSEIKDDDDYKLKMSDLKFINKRKIFFALSIILTTAATVLMYNHFIQMFSLMFGLTIAFIVMAIVIELLDNYVLPGYTIKRISNDSVASSILIFAFSVVVIGGAYIGNSLITNRQRSEDNIEQPIIKVERSAGAVISTDSTKSEGKEN